MTSLMLTLFHGTSSEYVRAIMSEGLRPGYDTKNGNYDHGLGQYVFLSRRYEDAFAYACETAHEPSKPVVLRVKVPADMVRPDPAQYWSSVGIDDAWSLVYEGTIAQSVIDRMASASIVERSR
jgi:hypothetical protein